MTDRKAIGEVEGMVTGSLGALNRMTEKERTLPVEAQLAQNYNDLLQQAKEVATGVASQRWPKPVDIFEAMTGQACNAKYVDVSVYLTQIRSLLLGALDDAER